MVRGKKERNYKGLRPQSSSKSSSIFLSCALNWWATESSFSVGRDRAHRLTSCYSTSPRSSRKAGLPRCWPTRVDE